MSKSVRAQGRFEAIDHTADVGYKLFAPTMAELFAIAGRALFATITDLRSIRKELSRSISATAEDQETLLIAWLSELNYRFLVDHELYCEFDIDALSPTSIHAIVHGEKIDRSRHDIFTEIKAVTYHALYLQKNADGWEAQIIFDV